jgi:hypothetical protein
MSQVKSQIEQLNEEPPASLLQECWQFIVENKKWWMIPILGALGFLGALALFAGTGAAPFIYTLF